ncbi:MAG TPA: rhomboid family intramembrane serine protease [Bacteroidia bacterium]|nr:rhomboid family intramembrane serine protease [Bacteroidia bacterium]
MKNYLARQIFRSFIYPFLFVVFIWLVFLLEHWSGRVFVNWGVLPRKPEGLPGIFTSVFIHGSLDHILSNTLPILILGGMVFYFYRKIAWPALLWIWLSSGLWLWIGGRNHVDSPQYHIGASTLIYGLAGFLFFSGVFRRHLQLMVVSALVVFLYGSLVWGVFPLDPEISWEGHLFGLFAGIMVAFNYRKEGPQRKKYVWENEEEEQDPEGGGAGENKDQRDIEIRFHYTPSKRKEDSDPQV